MSRVVPSRAMVLAAGEGRRLRPLTDELPKPALPVGNRPVAWFALDHLARAGFREVVLNAHHLAPQLRTEVEACTPPGLRVTFAEEARLLGTAGGIRNAWRPGEGEPFDEPFVVANGKLIFAPNLDGLLQRHADTGAIATMVLRSMPAGETFAPVETDVEGRVRRLRGLPASPVSNGLVARMFTGVQVLSPRAWKDLPVEGDLVEHGYLRWIERGEVIASVLDDGPWIDVGVTPAHYLAANLALATSAVTWPGIEPGPGSVLAAPSAHVGDGADLEAVVLGADAVVAPGVRLRRVVAWPGTQLARDLDGAVVTRDGGVVAIGERP